MDTREDVCLQELKNLIKDSNHKGLIGILSENWILLSFLRGRKYDVKYAFETLDYHFKIRFERYPEIFSNLRPSLFRHVLESGMIGILKQRDQDGRLICFLRICKWDTEHVTEDDIMKVSILLIEEAGLIKENQLNGIAMIFDYTGFSWEHAKQYNFLSLKRQVSIFLFSYPLRFGNGFVINPPRIGKAVYSLLKPFLPEKIKRRIHFCKDSFKTLHKKIPKEVLPNWLGGNLTDEEALDPTVVRSILEKEEYYANFNNQLYSSISGDQI